MKNKPFFMKVEFADTFGDSIKRLIRHNTWWYKTYSLFRYGIPRFLKNVWKFRNPLANHYWWDHHSLLKFMEIGISDMGDKMEKHGHEVDISRLKKVKAMKRAAELMRNYNEDLYIEMAEAELGEIINHDWEFEAVDDKPGYSKLIDKETEEEKAHNRKVFERSHEIAEEEWKELWRIIEGQDRREYQKILESLTEEEHKDEDHYYKWFDGTGLRGWWD
jgi:hypothetical protein